MGSVYTVSQVTSYIKNMFTQDFALNRISIKGEVSNCKYHTSGHIYFTLKDGGAQIAAVMFAGQAKSLDFHLTEGQEVVVSGTVDVYERDGRYQFYAKEIKGKAEAICSCALKNCGMNWKKWECLMDATNSLFPNMQKRLVSLLLLPAQRSVIS